ncbi:Membrane-bound lytic murein transglycosylase D precursor [compost metagenome]
MTVDGPQQLLVPTAKAQLLTASLSNMKPEELLSLQPKKAVFEAALAEASVPQATRNSRYRVKRGDSLGAIAKANKVSVKDLQRWNKLSGHSLKAGQTLVMQGAQPVQGKNAKKPTQYKVRKGDSLYLVAKRFNVEMQHLKRWNPRSGHALKPGQTLTVYVPH